MQTYELIHAKETLPDDNGGLIYGINWLDSKGNIVDCEWFKTQSERILSVYNYFVELEKGK